MLEDDLYRCCAPEFYIFEDTGLFQIVHLLCFGVGGACRALLVAGSRLIFRRGKWGSVLHQPLLLLQDSYGWGILIATGLFLLPQVAPKMIMPTLLPQAFGKSDWSKGKAFGVHDSSWKHPLQQRVGKQCFPGGRVWFFSIVFSLPSEKVAHAWEIRQGKNALD